MNKFFYGFITALTLLTLVGCAGLIGKNQGVFGNASKKQADQKERITALEQSESENSTARLNHIGAWSEGTKYTLDKVPEPSKEVVIAKDINERIQGLANKPDFNEVKEVKAIIDGLLSEMNAQQEAAKASLAKKDTEIYALGLEVKVLDESKRSEIRKALKMAEDSAAKADQYKATLNEMDSFFGLGAIWYGLVKLITRGAWFIGGGLVLFFILRMLAASNPIAGAIFAIFEQVISWFINMLKMLAPKAAQFSGFIESKVFDGYKTTLVHMIDSLQLLKEKESDGKKYGIDDLFVELDRAMDTSDKERVELIKKELHWK